MKPPPPNIRHFKPPLPLIQLLFNITLTIALSVAITLTNKHTLSLFPFPITLTALHQFACLLVTRLVPKTKSISFKNGINDAFIAGSTNALGIVLMNMSIMSNNITVHQIAKLLSAPTLVLLEFTLFGIPFPSRNACYAISFLLLGVALTTSIPNPISTQHPSSIFGLCITGAAVLTTAFAQAALQHLTTFKGMSGLGLVIVISPWSSLTSICLALLIDGVTPFRSSSIPYFPIATSCLLAVAANIVGNSLIKSTSALTYNVVGHLKTLFTIAFGIVLFPTQSHLSVVNVIGIVVAISGMSAYSFLQYQAATSVSKAKLSPVAAQFAIAEHPVTNRVLKPLRSRP